MPAADLPAVDAAPSNGPAAETPDSRDVPYARPITDALKQEMPVSR